MSTREESPTRASEQTPLLSRSDSPHAYEEANGIADPNDSQPHPEKSKRRWPTIIALSLLCIAIILALVFGFATPAAVEEYAKEAISFEADKLSIDSFTSIGIRARVQGTVWLDSTRVRKKSVRDLGRFATWIAKEAESGESELLVHLPDYHDALLGRAQLPPVKLNIQDGHYNFVDIVTDLEPGNVDGIRSLAHDFIEGNLKELRVRATAKVPVKSGLISLGAQTITQFLTFSASQVPSIPKIDLQKLKVAEHGLPGHPDGMKAWAEAAVMNDYPVKFDVPPMAFEILLPDCFNTDYLLFATTKTDTIHVLPKQMLNVSATGFMKQLPTSLTSACPHSDKSPLDTFIAGYLKGQKTTVYVRGGEQDPDTPAWIGKLLKDTIVPVPLPVKPFDNMIKNFSLTNVHFSLPQTPQGKPVLSATVKVLVGLPKDMNFDVDVGKVRADGTVFYHGEEMGKLDLSQWQEARSRKVDGDLLVESEVVNAPLEITDEDVFAKVVQRMIFERKSVPLGIQATVDVDATTALGTFIVNGIPAKGKIVFDAPNIGGFKHEVREISVVGSTPTSLTMEAKVNITNPTDYSASMPLVNVSTWVNGTKMGYAWASAEISPGENEVVAYTHWDKSTVGAEFLSQFISGHNVSLTVADPVMNGLPDLKMNFTLPVPHMFGKFMRDTTIHLLSSTATFILFSPLAMLVTAIDSTAYYNGSEIGTIVWDDPIPIEPGDNETPRLPVDWNTPGAGLIRDALGGRLKIDAFANVGVKIGEFREDIWYSAKGIGAHVRL